MGNLNIKLAKAAYSHDYEGMKKAIEAGADASDNRVFRNYDAPPHPYQNSAIASALQNRNHRGMYETVELLLDNGADPNAYDKYGHSVIFLAGLAHSPETVRLLASRGGKLQGDEKTLLDIVMDNPYGTSQHQINKTVEALIESGADPDVQCQDETCDKYSKYFWNRINDNINRQSSEYGSANKNNLPKDIWRLILLREKQQSLCQDLQSPKYKHLLYYFAEYLDIPVTKDMNKDTLCHLISGKLSNT